MWDTLDSDSDYTASGEEEEQEEQEDQGEKEEEEEEVSRSIVMSDCVARFCFHPFQLPLFNHCLHH